jgi:hypothetical protein
MRLTHALPDCQGGPCWYNLQYLDIKVLYKAGRYRQVIPVLPGHVRKFREFSIVFPIVSFDTQIYGPQCYPK